MTSSADADRSIFDLTDRVAVVTGGNGGIGLGIALGLARAGADVAIWSRNEAKNEAAIGQLEAVGARAISLRCDVSSEDAVRKACADTVEALGRIDICFANAGFSEFGDPLKMKLASWRRVLATNLDGAFLTFREVARHMVERGGGGKLIAISSMVEKFGSPKQPAYAASKGALGGLIRSYAVELARHDIQVNSVQPGWILTEALAPLASNEKVSKVVLARTPARRLGDVRDLEGIAVYLASDASRYHTGDSICVDGGYSIF